MVSSADCETTASSKDSILRTSGPNKLNESSNTVTADELYMMKAHGKRGQKSPMRVEFLRNTRPNRRLYHHHRPNSLNRSDPRGCPNQHLRRGYSQFNLINQQMGNKVNKSDILNTAEQARSISKMQLLHDTQMSNDLKPNDELSSVIDCAERIEVYYFDHGNSAYFRTTDCPPHIASEIIAERSTYFAIKFWAEIFGSIHIGIAFIIAFILQTYRFVLYSIIRPIIVGLFQMTSDYLIKPILTILFNGILQPPFILLYNVFSSLSDMLEPIAKALNHFLRPIASMFQSIRLVDVNQRHFNGQPMESMDKHITTEESRCLINDSSSEANVEEKEKILKDSGAIV